VANTAISEFSQSHSFVSGVLLIAIGVAGIIGSVSGNLAGMIAALIDPTDLYTVKAAALGGPPGIPTPTPSEPGTEPTEPANPALPAQPSIPAPETPSLPGIGDLPIIAA
jgi:hypothetical protein